MPFLSPFDTLLAWRNLLLQYPQAMQRYQICIPIKTLGHLIPCTKIDKWVDRGLLWVEELFNGTVLNNMVRLRKNYGFTTADKFMFIRKGKFLSEHPFPMISVDSSVWSFFTSLHSNTIRILLFYNLRKQKYIFVKTSSILKWRMNLGQPFTSFQWLSAFKSIYSSSHCVNHRELLQKLIGRPPTNRPNFLCITPLSVGEDAGKQVPFTIYFGPAETSPVSGVKYLNCFPISQESFLSLILHWQSWTYKLMTYPHPIV